MSGISTGGVEAYAEWQGPRFASTTVVPKHLWQRKSWHPPHSTPSLSGTSSPQPPTMQSPSQTLVVLLGPESTSHLVERNPSSVPVFSYFHDSTSSPRQRIARATYSRLAGRENDFTAGPARGLKYPNASPAQRRMQLGHVCVHVPQLGPQSLGAPRLDPERAALALRPTAQTPLWFT